MPLWKDLGEVLSRDIGDYKHSTPLDAVSAYEHEFGRSKLLEKLSEMLFIDEARPGTAHKASPPLDFLRNHIGIIQRVLPNDQYEVQF
jgi:hypothetical protein